MGMLACSAPVMHRVRVGLERRREIAEYDTHGQFREVRRELREHRVLRPDLGPPIAIAPRAQKQTEMRNRRREFPDLVHPVPMPAIVGQQMVHRLVRTDIRDHYIGADVLPLRRLHTDDSVVLEEQRLYPGIRPCFATTCGDRRQDMVCKGRAAPKANTSHGLTLC